MWKIFLAAFVLMIFNSLLTYKQAKNFSVSFNDVHKYGNVSVGKDKQYFVYGVIVILACDNNGLVTKGQMMNGFSVFARFKPFDDLVGKSIYEIKSEEELKVKTFRSKKRREKGSAVLQAVNGLIGVLERSNAAEMSEEELIGGDTIAENA